MLSELGHIVLTDFGSAKILEVTEKAHSIAGTPQYIAPEVLRGEPYGFSADWWSCGILLYEMLVGKVRMNCRGVDLLVEYGGIFHSRLFSSITYYSVIGIKVGIN